MEKKRLVAFIIVLLAGGQFALGQTTPTALDVENSPPSPAAGSTNLSQSVFLDVSDLGNDVSTTTNWKTTWGSYSKSQQRVRALEVVLRNPAKLPGEYLIEWFFFASPVRGGKRILHDHGSKTIPLTPGGLEKAAVVSAEYSSSSTRYSGSYYYRNTYKYGSKPDGWAVRVRIGGKIVRTKTSGAAIDDLLKNADAFDATVKEWDGQHPR